MGLPGRLRPPLRISTCFVSLSMLAVARDLVGEAREAGGRQAPFRGRRARLPEGVCVCVRVCARSWKPPPPHRPARPREGCMRSAPADFRKGSAGSLRPSGRVKEERKQKSTTTMNKASVPELLNENDQWISELRGQIAFHPLHGPLGTDSLMNAGRGLF